MTTIEQPLAGGGDGIAGILDRERIIATPDSIAGWCRRRRSHPSLHRHGLRLQRVLAAAVARHRHSAPEACPDMSILAGTVHHDLRLAGQPTRLDVHAVLRLPRLVRGDLGRLAGTGRTAQGGRRRRVVLVRRLSISARSASISHQLWMMWLGSGVIGGIGSASAISRRSRR